LKWRRVRRRGDPAHDPYTDNIAFVCPDALCNPLKRQAGEGLKKYAAPQYDQTTGHCLPKKSDLAQAGSRCEAFRARTEDSFLNAVLEILNII
jgi:hypothetical protein